MRDNVPKVLHGSDFKISANHKQHPNVTSDRDQE